MADAKKEYKDMLKILGAMATPAIAATKLNALSVDAQDDRIKEYSQKVSNWLVKYGGRSTGKIRILSGAENQAKDPTSIHHQFGLAVVALRDYCDRQIASADPAWYAIARSAGWVPDWKATAEANGWTAPPSPAAEGGA